MGVLSDEQIIELCNSREPMIEQFIREPTREVDGKRVVSYGVTSYGYDMRVAPEWLLFRDKPPLDGRIIDPLNFDSSIGQKIGGPELVMPPRSFALARTVEYFRIPRDVLGLCFGKCLTADTRVLNAETGGYVRLVDAKDSLKVTAALDGWKTVPAKVSNFYSNGIQKVYKVTTKAGRTIRCTANHPFRTIDGWRNLQDLRVGSRVAIARELPFFGKKAAPRWEMTLLGLMISEGSCATPGSSPVFTNKDCVLVESLTAAVEESGLGECSHDGRLGYRLVNKIGKGGAASHNNFTKWLQEHNCAALSGDKDIPQVVYEADRESTRVFLRALFSGDGGVYKAANGSPFVEYYTKSHALAEGVHHLLLRFGIFARLQSKTTWAGTDAYTLSLTDKSQIALFCRKLGFIEGSEKQIRLETDVFPTVQSDSKRGRLDTLPPETWELVKELSDRTGVSIRRLAGTTGGAPTSQSLPMAMAKRIALGAGSRELLDLVEGPRWDTISAIEFDGEEEVYDISVPSAENFVANGIFVHNSTYARCGMYVGITPLEPSWTGHVTIELANNTPWPLKVYGNQGISQVIFVRGEGVCLKSYADKGGKYQGQTGITLPKG